MNTQQARLVGAGVTLVLALICGAIAGFVAPHGKSSDSVSTPISDTSVTPTPTESASPSRTPRPSKSPTAKPSVTPSETDTPTDEPTPTPSKSIKPSSSVSPKVGGGPAQIQNPVGSGAADGATSDVTETPTDGVSGPATDAPDTSSDSNDSHFALAPAAVAFCGVAATGIILIVVFSMAARREREESEAASAYQGAGGGSGHTATRVMPAMSDTETRRSRSDRATMVDALIYVRDRATSTAISDRLAATLRSVGVMEVSPVGERFDPSRHEAGGTELTNDPSLYDSVSGVEVVGYTDSDGTVIRPPVVTVYRREGQ